MSKGPIAKRGYNSHYRYYNADNKEEENEVNKHHRNFQTLRELLEQVDKKVKPTGTLDRPARTCRELFTSWKHLKSGRYFIDPNEGASSDAVLVECRRNTLESCIKPADSFNVDNKNWGNFDDSYKWVMADLKKSDMIEYAMSIPQMKLLQMLSTDARQNFTYHCKNSFALTNEKGVQSSNPLKFKMDNEDVDTLAVKVESRRIMYDVIHDECATKSWTWGKTQIEIRTKNSEQLPVLDVATHDIGGYDEEFGLEVGPVCFS